MSTLVVPELDETPWPSLGSQVCAFIEENLVHGPGDLLGQPARLDAEKRALIFRAYEVYPADHPLAGRRRFKRVAISLRKGSAKALALTTPLPTPTGWTTMGDVSVGDILLGSDGRACRVTALSPIFIGRPCYRVGFNDGTSIVADAEHRWATMTRRWPREGAGIFTTEEIRKTLFWHPRKPYSNHRIPVTAPLDLPIRALAIDPYILGVWLGDGTTQRGEITSADPEIWDSITADGYRLSYSYPAGRAVTRGIPGLVTQLRSVGVLGQKRIPSAYLRASFDQRLALLQGMMDTDGTAADPDAGRGYCSLTTVLEPLAKDFMELARSLGLRPWLSTRRARVNGKDCGPAFQVGFTPREDVPPFRLQRKAAMARRKARKVSQALARTIRSVDPVPTVPVRCVAVDSADHLYLAGEGMVPTHNTEWAAWLAICELHPEGPVRCDGFDAAGEPVGVGVTDPYIPLVAVSEEQSEELAYGAMKAILEHCDLADDFDIGLERIMRKSGYGKAVAMASSPDARDGARTTFQVMDETHRFTQPRLKKAHQTMLANVPKRKKADAWTLETTTAPAPGERSVAEETMEYAQQVAHGKVTDSKLFFFHRQAEDGCDLSTEEGIRKAVLEASGPLAEWSDIEGIVGQFKDPTADLSFLCRVWLNQLRKTADKAFDRQKWDEAGRPDYVIPDGAVITLGFDGARYVDSSALVATEVSTGFQQLLGLWERPYGPEGEKWEVSEAEVNNAVDAAMTRWSVWRFYCDPPYWESTVAGWSGTYGEERVVAWRTNQWVKIAYAVLAYCNAIVAGDLSHDGNKAFALHISNAYKRSLPQRDENGVPLWVIQKERPMSPNKIDAAMAGVLSWAARSDAMTLGVGRPSGPSVYEERGLLVL